MRRLRLAELVDVPSPKTVHLNSTVETVVNALLGVTCHDSLNRCKVVRVNHERGELHRDIRCIDVTCVEQALALMSNDDAPCRRLWIPINLVPVLE